LNILYYGEPNIETGGGVSNVAYYLPHALRKKLNVTYLREIKANRDFLETYFNIFNQFVKKEFDIIHYNTNPTWINGSSLLQRFAKLRQTPTVLTIHGIPHLETRAEQWRSVSFFKWMSILSYCNLADRIIVNSEYMRNNVVVCYGLSRDKVVVIPNGVNLKMFTESNNNMKLDGDPSILYIGHLSRLKGVDILIHSVAQLRNELTNIKLHLVGRGNVRGLELLARNEGIEENVVFHNWAKQSLTPSYYKGADICVFPSRQEGFGIVILEAMASGTPVIASDIPSFRELISNGVDGQLFKLEDPQDLSKKIIALFKDPALRKKLARNASEKVKMYDWEKIAEKYISLYMLLRK
jgi:glycosyltransferase involved in cell wall biosynthesis